MNEGTVCKEELLSPSSLGNSTSASFFSPRRIPNVASVLHFSDNKDVELKPLEDVFGDEMVEELSPGWKCHYCNKTWSSVNITRIIHHFVSTERGGITKCTNTSNRLTKARKQRFQDLYTKLQTKRIKMKTSYETNPYQSHESSLLGTQPEVLPDASMSAHSLSDNSSKPSKINVLSKIRPQNQSSIEGSFYGNAELLSSTIAKFVLTAGLPFSVVSRPAFKEMIKQAQHQPHNYKPPTRQQVANHHLNEMAKQVDAENEKQLQQNGKIFGIYFYGDSATIYRRPLLNIMAGSAGTSAMVLGIVDATTEYKKGRKKDSKYIAKQFLPFLKKHDEFKKLTDCVFFDGASDVQKAGRIIQSVYPNTTVLHGVEHVCALFARDVCNLPAIKAVIDRYKLLYKHFGSGIRHGAHAIFKKYSTEHNHGRYLGLLRATDVRFAGYFIALHRLLRNKKALMSVVTSTEFEKYKFNGQNKSLLKETLVEIVQDAAFWREVETIVITMFPVLQILRLADSNKPGMDKAYYYARRTTSALEDLAHYYDGSPENQVFEARIFTMDVEDVFSTSQEDESDSESEGSDDDYTKEDDEDIISLTDSDNPPILLSHKIQSLWNHRFASIASDFAILAWMMSVQPDVYQDAKDTINENYRRIAERALKRLWLPDSLNEELWDNMLSQFWELEYEFHHHENEVYSNIRIFNDKFVRSGESHKWHNAHWNDKTKIFSSTGARVCSKILGIGASERCWGDVKHLLGTKRRSLTSERLFKQTLIYTTNAINEARAKAKKSEDNWVNWDERVLRFNDSLLTHGIGQLSQTNISKLKGIGCYASQKTTPVAYPSRFAKSENNYRVFNAYLEEGIDTPGDQRIPSDIVEMKILMKYGGLFIADDNDDGEGTQIVRRIYDTKLTRTVDERTGRDKKEYCVYALEALQPMINKNTTTFVVNDHLIAAVVAAENSNMIIYNKEKEVINPQVFRKEHILGNSDKPDSYWNFVAQQKRLFPNNQCLEQLGNPSIRPLKKIKSNFI